MNVLITCTAVKHKDTTISYVGNLYLTGQELELRTNKTLLTVYNPMSKTEYITDFASASVPAILAAAVDTGGWFLLT